LLDSVTTCAGQPSLFSSDWAIDHACEVGNSYTVPDNLRYHLLIYRYMVRVNKAMAKRTRSPVGQPTERESDGLMKLLECDFEDLERQIGDKAGSKHPCPLNVNPAENFADIHLIALTMACLQLRVYYFFESPVSETRKQGLLRVYTTALNLIFKVADADTKGDFIKYAPNVFCLSLNTSGMLIMKIINSSYSRYVDIEGGKLAFNKVLALLRRASLEDNDVRGRGGKILAQLWTVHHSRTVRREQEPSLRVKSRFGASVLHDGLWAWREEFGGQASPQSGFSQPISNPTQSTSSTSPDALFQPPQPTTSKSFTVIEIRESANV
jgi:transcriptional regulatory protein LEU3